MLGNIAYRSVLLTAVFICSEMAYCGDCPCGPDNLPPALQALVPQEFAGADFRPACRAHDACYDTPGSSKRQCDKKFLRDMQCACESSRCPMMCRVVARLMHASVRFGGSQAFNNAQTAARGR